MKSDMAQAIASAVAKLTASSWCVFFATSKRHFGAISVRQFAPQFRFYMVYCKWIYFEYVLSFVFGKSVFPTLYFQQVLSFAYFFITETLSPNATDPICPSRC